MPDRTGMDVTTRPDSSLKQHPQIWVADRGYRKTVNQPLTRRTAVNAGTTRPEQYAELERVLYDVVETKV